MNYRKFPFLMLTILFSSMTILSFAKDNPNTKKAMSLVESGYATAKKGNTEEAIEIFKKAISIDPNLPEAHMLLGSLYMGTKKYDASILELKKAIELNPNVSPDAYANLIMVLLYKDNTEAVTYLKKLATVDPKTAKEMGMQLILSRIYGVRETETGFFIPMGSTLNPAVMGKGLKDAMRSAEKYEMTGDYEKALEVYRVFLKESDASLGDKAYANFYIGSGYSQQLNKPQDGLPFINEAIKLNPKEIHYHIGLIDTYRVLLDDDKNALKAIEGLFAVDAGNKYGLYSEGLIYFQKKDWDKTVAAWNKLKDKDEMMGAFIDEQYTEAFYQYLGARFHGSHSVVLKRGIELKPDDYVKEKESLFLIFKGNMTEPKKYEQAVFITFNEVETVDGKPHNMKSSGN